MSTVAADEIDISRRRRRRRRCRKATTPPTPMAPLKKRTYSGQ